MTNMQACATLALGFCLAGNGAPPDARPYIAVIEKAAGAVGFYDESGKELGQVKVEASRTKPCFRAMGGCFM